MRFHFLPFLLSISFAFVSNAFFSDSYLSFAGPCMSISAEKSFTDANRTLERGTFTVYEPMKVKGEEGEYLVQPGTYDVRLTRAKNLHGITFLIEGRDFEVKITSPFKRR